MKRKKHEIRKMEKTTRRNATLYRKRTEGIIKKANVLSILCGTDIALVMFSPFGHPTVFATDGRAEDIFLRFVDMPNEQRRGALNNEELLSQKLKQIKSERQMLEKITIIEKLEEKLNQLKSSQNELREKMRVIHVKEEARRGSSMRVEPELTISSFGNN